MYVVAGNGKSTWLTDSQLVWTNMYKVNVHHVQQENDWIEGPMSTLDEDRMRLLLALPNQI